MCFEMTKKGLAMFCGSGSGHVFLQRGVSSLHGVLMPLQGWPVCLLFSFALVWQRCPHLSQPLIASCPRMCHHGLGNNFIASKGQCETGWWSNQSWMGYKRGIYLDEEENSNPHHPSAPTGRVCIALLSICSCGALSKWLLSFFWMVILLMVILCALALYFPSEVFIIN